MKVLDQGSLDIMDVLGDDQMVVNAARVSFNNDDWGKLEPGDTLTVKDEKLIRYLVEHKHVSPFYHPHVTVRIKAPISVQRQLVTHKVGTAMNSESTRYTEIKREFYVPGRMRAQSTNNKQGSSDFVFSDGVESDLIEAYKTVCSAAFSTYEYMLAHGVAKELAREVLPLCTYTSWVWTVSLQAAAHFINLRTDSHAQFEIRQYALALRELLTPYFPISLPLLTEGVA